MRQSRNIFAATIRLHPNIFDGEIVAKKSMTRFSASIWEVCRKAWTLTTVLDTRSLMFISSTRRKMPTGMVSRINISGRYSLRNLVNYSPLITHCAPVRAWVASAPQNTTLLVLDDDLPPTKHRPLKPEHLFGGMSHPCQCFQGLLRDAIF